MNVVLERLRNGGVVGVLEGMSRDRMEVMGGQEGHWKRVWTNGNQEGNPDPLESDFKSDQLKHDR